MANEWSGQESVLENEDRISKSGTFCGRTLTQSQPHQAGHSRHKDPEHQHQHQHQETKKSNTFALCPICGIAGENFP
jgi:hypothetical protein